MKASTLSLIAVPAFLLAACGSANVAGQDRLANPLYARYYYQDLMDTMAGYLIREDPMLQDAEKKGAVENVRDRAVEKLKDANARINAGKRGGFMSDTDYAVGGTLRLGDKLYFGQDFNTLPSPEMYVFVSTMIDPRGESGAILFPDATAVNLGRLQSPYGAQTYVIPEEHADEAFRTVVLWDKRLERLMGFSQLN